MRKLLIIAFCSIAGMLFGAEYTVQTVPNPKTTNKHAYVSNPDGILKSETVEQLNVQLDSLESNTGAEVVVVALNSIGGADYLEFANKLFEEWKVGKAKIDNGLLVLFVLDQRRVKFETGYGLEGVLSDGICSRIRTQVMNPEFKKGNYDAGMLAGIGQVSSIIRKEPVQAPVVKSIPWSEILPFAAGIYLLVMLFSIAWLHNSVQKIKRNSKLPSNLARYKAIKSETTAIVGLVAIIVPIVGLVVILLFSKAIYLLLLLPVPFTTVPAKVYGMLAMRKARRTPIPCNVCNGKMHILSERKEDAHLKLAQQFEEKLQAVDYDVFVCNQCSNQAIYTLDKPSVYSECPKCGTKAFILSEKRMLISPTYISAGTERTTYRCKFCGHEQNNNHNIPRLTRGGGSGGSFLGGAIAGGLLSGGFGGGGFGDGGDSGGGSFGGGMSGGGGSGGEW